MLFLDNLMISNRSTYQRKKKIQGFESRREKNAKECKGETRKRGGGREISCLNLGKVKQHKDKSELSLKYICIKELEI